MSSEYVIFQQTCLNTFNLSQTTNSPAHCVDRLRASAKFDCGEEDQTETHHFQQNWKVASNYKDLHEIDSSHCEYSHDMNNGDSSRLLFDLTLDQEHFLTSQLYYNGFRGWLNSFPRFRCLIERSRMEIFSKFDRLRSAHP